MLIQTAVPLWFPFHALIPNLVIILTVDLGLRHHGAMPALMAFAIGYATDALSGTILGMNAFLTTAIFLLTYEMSSRLLVTNVLVGAIAVFLAVLVAGVGNGGIHHRPRHYGRDEYRLPPTRSAGAGFRCDSADHICDNGGDETGNRIA